jgi:hypothetical protein
MIGHSRHTIPVLVACVLVVLMNVRAASATPNDQQPLELNSSIFAPDGSPKVLNLSEEPTHIEEPASEPIEASGADASEEDLAKLTQNPVAKLISVPFQSNFNFGVGPREVTQYVLNVQPVIPITLSDDWNLITRTIIPIVNQPSPADGIPSAFGLGDINPTFFFSPAHPGKLVWGFGPTFTFPTGTNELLTSGEFSAGPAFVGLYRDGPFVAGALTNQQWSFAGWGNYVSQFLFQPFFNYNVPHGWYLVTSPIFTANWAAQSHNVWLIPVGGGVGKIVKFGELPVNFSLQAFANVVRPDAAPAWTLRFQIQFLFPK